MGIAVIEEKSNIIKNELSGQKSRKKAKKTLKQNDKILNNSFQKKSNFNFNKSLDLNNEEFTYEYYSDGENTLNDDEENNKKISIEEKFTSIKAKKGKNKNDEHNQEIQTNKDRVKNNDQKKKTKTKMNKNNGNKKNQKKANKFKEKYEKKLKKLEEKKEELLKKLKKLAEKESKYKKNFETYSKEISEIKEKKKTFENEKNERNIKVKQLKKKNMEQEEELTKQKEKYFPEIKPILIGLDNIGATCYMNASLECLSNTKELTEYFLKSYKKDPNKIMANEYYEVLKNLWDIKNNNKSYSPYSFKEVLSKENPLFAGIAANDSKDLINFLTERFHQELNNKINNNSNPDLWSQIDQSNELVVLKSFLNDFITNFNSPISKLFYGITETKSQCQSCGITKYNFQVYSFLEFPLQQVNQYFFSNGKKPMLTADGRIPDVNLYECFEYNRKVDLMFGDNQMYCNICKRQCNSTYTTSLYTGPKYLILHLNRGKGAVYGCNVIFPEILNLFDFFTYRQDVTVYELYAVICHLGPSSMSGHFVAYCKNSTDHKWYLYNDAIVSLCSRKEQYNDGMPYILFYKTLTSDD